MRWRLFQRLEHRIECEVGQHVYFVDQVHLEAAPGRQILHVLEQFPRVVHLGARGSVHLDQIHEAARIDVDAGGAFAAGTGRLAALVRRTRAVITTVGPYQLHGEPLATVLPTTPFVGACRTDPVTDDAGRRVERHAPGCRPGAGGHHGSGEFQVAVDLLTTNETYFFRESAHFEHLAGLARTASKPMRVWSAASSSGEEAYSIAMTLARHARNPGWEIVGTDLSTKVVALAQRGLYPTDRCRHVSPDDLKRWCLKGQGEYEGQVLMSPELRQRVRFGQVNLTRPISGVGDCRCCRSRGIAQRLAALNPEVLPVVVLLHNRIQVHLLKEIGRAHV